MQRSRKTVKIKDIAAELGVSNSLVSKVISGNLGTTKVRPELQEKILKRAKELDFRPNPLSSALKRGRFGAIGLLIHPIGVPGSELLDRLLMGVTKELNNHGLRLWLQFFEDDQGFFDFCNQEIYRSVDGLIVAGVPHRETYSLIENLNKDGLPVVTSFRRHSVPGVANITYSDKLQGKLATQHLIQKGCQRPAFLCTDDPEDQREVGYREAMAEAKLSVDQGLLVSTEKFPQMHIFSFMAGRAMAEKMVTSGLKFDGIIAQSDQQAIGAINYLREQGIKVPEQVRVIGVDDSPMCTASTIPLSSVSPEMATIGHELIKNLVGYIDGKKPESIDITPKLIERESTR
ncbi:LacI family DNA-binding transcriptional regulator [Cerasicoccus fimbriatus]|uniref:LacI family DNA-binding transcriptional regulator n=1 Tax=Cerasicoccus fimbriatus TaxID=3014554 RepID=UPI0022B594D4|nr:LacI family DNA-binding transcriptional regulator [Cerasicoccus sp. TK19100]